MHFIKRGRHRLAALAVVAVTVALIAAVLAMSHPWTANAANPAKSTPEVGDERQRADVGTDAGVNPWAANGVSPARLQAAGWDCIYAVHAVHCAAAGVLEDVSTGAAETFTVLVFDTTDPGSADASSFLGTEFNIRADLFHGQPCPSDPPTREYTYLPDIGVPFEYYGCHRFDSPL
jgi:hypothetical protein